MSFLYILIIKSTKKLFLQLKFVFPTKQFIDKNKNWNNIVLIKKKRLEINYILRILFRRNLYLEINKQLWIWCGEIYKHVEFILDDFRDGNIFCLSERNIEIALRPFNIWSLMKTIDEIFQESESWLMYYNHLKSLVFASY